MCRLDIQELGLNAYYIPPAYELSDTRCLEIEAFPSQGCTVDLHATRARFLVLGGSCEGDIAPALAIASINDGTAAIASEKRSLLD